MQALPLPQNMVADGASRVDDAEVPTPAPAAAQASISKETGLLSFFLTLLGHLPRLPEVRTRHIGFRKPWWCQGSISPSEPPPQCFTNADVKTAVPASHLDVTPYAAR